MRCNVLKLRAARDRRALTQEKLAAEAKVDIRTVQRAEAGAPLRQDTIADIAAVLGVPLAALIDRSSPQSEEGVVAGIIFGAGVTLKRATTAREIIELLEDTHLAKLECDADPTEELMTDLADAISFIEGMLPHPWSEEEQNGPLTFNSLVTRLQHIAKLNTVLDALERHGLALFVGSTWVNAIMPSWGEEGLYTRTGQRPDNVRATRLLISPHVAERVSVQAATKWPVEIVTPEPAVDWDEEVPF
jgi:transcriptional regulator with XRE-family HTH domain